MTGWVDPNSRYKGMPMAGRYNNRAEWSRDYHSLRVGRRAYLDSDRSARVDKARGITLGVAVKLGRHDYVKVGETPAPPTPPVTGALLLETGGYLLLETTGIVLL